MNQKVSIPSRPIQDFCHRYHVRELSIFGSAVRNDFHAASDIDLLVDFMPGAQIGYLTLLRMQRELSGILKRRVDLVPKGGLKAKIRKEILTQARVIYLEPDTPRLNGAISSDFEISPFMPIFLSTGQSYGSRLRRRYRN